MELPEKINFELVSPEEKLVSEEAYMVVVPGDEGNFAAMPGSASTLASLKPGVVTIFWEKEEQSPLKVFISGGFVDVTGKQCTILAETADDVADFDRTEIEQTIRNLQEDLSLAKDKRQKSQVQENLAIAKSKLEAVTGKAIISL